MRAIHVVDTGLIAAMGQPSNRRYRAVCGFARRESFTFVLPERVYDELIVGNTAVNAPPVDTAIDEGWVRIADPLEYSRPLVSRTMDGVGRYIANADDRPVDEVERADAALAGVAAQAFATGAIDRCDGIIYQGMTR